MLSIEKIKEVILPSYCFCNSIFYFMQLDTWIANSSKVQIEQKEEAEKLVDLHTSKHDSEVCFIDISSIIINYYFL